MRNNSEWYGNKNDAFVVNSMKEILKSGKKPGPKTNDITYKCMVGLRNPSKEHKINFKEHEESISKAITACNEVSKDTSVKILRIDIDTISIKIISNKNLIGKDDFYFACLNTIGTSLMVLGLKKYSESTNGLLTIIDIEEIKVNNVADDKSNIVDIELLIKKIHLLSELVVMGLDEDGSRSNAILDISDTVNNVLL